MLDKHNQLEYTLKGPKQVTLLAADAVRNVLNTGDNTITDLDVFHRTVSQFIVNFRSQCPVCSSPHQRTVDRISACGENTCMVRFMEEGMIGRSITADIISDPEAVELLICMTYWATYERATYWDTYERPEDWNFNYFPQRFLERSPGNKAAQYPAIRAALNRLPSVPEMQQMIKSGSFEINMQDDAYYLLQWIINSSRTQLKHIKFEDQTKEEKTISHNNTYRLFKVINSPEKEHEFEVQKKANWNWTQFAHHGSTASSWHSIIRNSLKNLNGRGIYFAKDFNYSYGYAQPPYTTPYYYYSGRPMSIDNWAKNTLGIIRCVLLAELVVPWVYAGAAIHVVSKENNVIVRYLICATK